MNSQVVYVMNSFSDCLFAETRKFVYYNTVRMFVSEEVSVLYNFVECINWSFCA